MDRAIDLSHDNPESDAEAYRAHHLTIFGHLPQPGDDGRCTHPIHDQIRRTMNGASYTIDFDPREIVSDDSVAQLQYDALYQLKYQWAKDMIREIDEETEYDRLRKLGIITAR